MASTPVAAASATAGGKVLNATCQPTSASTSTVEDMESVLWVPASATLVIRVIIVKKVRRTDTKGYICYKLSYVIRCSAEHFNTALHYFELLTFRNLMKTSLHN